MGFFVSSTWFAALVLCPIYMGVGVLGALTLVPCTTEHMDIEGGNYTLTKDLVPGSMLVYHCAEGYYPYPEMIRKCQRNGNWNPPPRKRYPAKCKLMECPDPNVLGNGYVQPPQETYFVSNVTTYHCYSGYALRGSASRVCQTNAKWSGSTPICSRDSGDRCSDPGVPAGAIRTGNLFGIDEKVTYRCNGRLNLVGSQERICQADGQWSGAEPNCYYKHTYDTVLEITEAFGTAIRQSLSSLESTNDTQEGKKIFIQEDGLLNIYIAMDVSDSIERKEFDHARKAVKQLINKIASFPVNPNYEILFFSSEIIEVVSILDAKPVLEKVLELLDKFTYTDRDDVGTDINLAFNTILERMQILKQRHKNFEDFRHVLIFFTDGGYNMGGSPENTVARIKDVVYMGDEKKRDEYLDIYFFGVGNDIFEDDINSLATKRNNGEKHYFKVETLEKLERTFDQIIDESKVVGHCGLHRSYDDDTRSTIMERFPWLVKITLTRSTGVSHCLGTLVTARFILTAAHCFEFDDTPSNVQLQINDQKSKGSAGTKIEDIILHPDYNIKAKQNEGVQEFYDFDVALIKLKHADQVDFSIKARPICIPCTKETNGALHLVGDDITCKQQEELLLKSVFERVHFLTDDREDRNKRIKQKDAFVKLGSQRDHCIKFALDAAGVTTEKPEVVVTDNFLCTGGSVHERNHAACKGDSGGGVYKVHQHRAIQVGLVSWGTKDMCQGQPTRMVDSEDPARDFHINLFKVVPFLKKVLGDDTQDFTPLQFLD